MVMVNFVAVMVYGRHGCGRHGLWPSWYRLDNSTVQTAAMGKIPRSTERILVLLLFLSNLFVTFVTDGLSGSLQYLFTAF